MVVARIRGGVCFVIGDSTLKAKPVSKNLRRILNRLDRPSPLSKVALIRNPRLPIIHIWRNIRKIFCCVAKQNVDDIQVPQDEMNGPATSQTTTLPPIPQQPPVSIKKHPPSTPAPATAPPAPPTTSRPKSDVVTRPPPSNSNLNQTSANGVKPQTGLKSKKKSDPIPPDPSVMYENVKSRIDALEKANVQEEEEDRKLAEDARKDIKGLPDSAVQAKFIELFQEMKRVEREHAKEKQKLTKEKDASKSQLTKSNQAKLKLESLARELQKDNKKLREDTKNLKTNVDIAQEEAAILRSELDRRPEKGKRKSNTSDSSYLVVKVVCKYRAEMLFKVNRKNKLSKVFDAWTHKMETSSENANPGSPGKESNSKETTSLSPLSFVFTHMGRTVEPHMTYDDVGIEDGDEILAVEMMDLTGSDAEDLVPEPQRQKLRKQWTENPPEAKQILEEIFDGVTRERLKEVLRQYELRERHFETVVRSKELEILLSRARAEEQKQLAEGERQIATVAETQNQQIRQQMEEMQNNQTRLMDKLIACCREPTGERTQRLFAFLREELEKRGAKPPDFGEIMANGVGGGKDNLQPGVVQFGPANGELGDHNASKNGMAKGILNGVS